MNRCRIDPVALKASFVGAALYKVGNNLISYSATIGENRLFARIIVDSSITSDEEDLIYDILGGIVGDFDDAYGDFELIKIESGVSPSDFELLPIKLFHRAV